MKKSMKKSFFALLTGSLFLFNACSSDDDSTTTSPSDPSTSTEVDVTANITSSTTWTAGNEYILRGRIYVTNGATLTIEPGVVVKGASGTGTNSKALIIDRGAEINAVGNPTTPIIFTSIADDLTSAQVVSGTTVGSLDAGVNGQWGGLIMLGNAPIEASETQLQIEGIPSSEPALYGGTDIADSSGRLQYVSIRHGGTNIGAGNEINGLTLGGVGNGTIIDHIEIVANQDDGIEWFGGSVNVNHAIVWNVGDDAIDTDQGWSGTLDNFVAVTPGGNGLELDGPEDDDSGTTSHTLSNGEIRNPGGLLAQLDSDSRVVFNNILFTGLEDQDEDEDGIQPASIDRVMASNGNLTFNNVRINVLSGTSLADYLPAGTIPGGITDGATSTVTTSEFGGGWSWAGSVLGF